MNSKWIKVIACIAVGAILYNMPAPMGIKAQGWHLMSIFLAMILGFILQPFSIGVTAFIAVTLTGLLGVLKPGQALSGFGSGTVWLIVAAFLFSRGFIKTGLGNRIAYSCMKRFGDSTLKLGYTLCFSNFIISPAIPSNTARGGGIMFPIVKSLAEVFDSRPGPTAKKIGAFLIQAVCQADNIACCVMMTAVSGNFLIVTLAKDIAGVELDWGSWFLAAIVPGLIALVIIPYAIYKLCPPTLKKTPEARELSEKKLAEMGPMSIAEKILAAIFIIAILGWATSSITKINATIIAMAGVCVMLITNTITWSDVKKEEGAWDALVWMGCIFGLADNLNKLGVIKGLASGIGAQLAGIPWLTGLMIVFVLYVLSTYCFASGVAHIAACYTAMVGVAISIGAPAYLAVLMLAYGQGFTQSLTHYSSGPTAVFFSGGYLSQREWWKLGIICVLINIVIWTTIGTAWWKVLGLW